MRIKIISDADCNLYIDQERIAQVPANELTIIPVEKGEYIVKYECAEHHQLSIEKDLLVEYDKVERISFLDYALAHKEILKGCSKTVVKGDNGLFGYALHNTSLIVIPCIYEEAEDFYDRDGREMAYVHKNGFATFIDGQGDPIIPLGQYVEMDYRSNVFVARDDEGRRVVLSDEGVKMSDIVDGDNGMANKPIYGYYNLIAISDSRCSEGKMRAFFPNGSLIDSLGEFEEIQELFIPDVYHFTPCSPYYIITKNGRTGIVRVDRRNNQVVWILPCDNILKSHWGRRSDDMYDPICGGPIEEFDTFGMAELSNPQSNTYSCIRNYPKHDILVVTEETDDENGPNVPRKETMYNNQGRVVLQREDVEIGIFSYGEAVIKYRNGESHLIDAAGRVFDRRVE